MADQVNKLLLFHLIDEIMEDDSSESEDSEISSDEDDEDDEDAEWENSCITLMHVLTQKNDVRKITNYVQEVIPSYTNEEFKSHFRMLPSTFNYILEKIKPALERKRPGAQMIAPNKQLFIAISKIAAPDSYQSICERFNVSRATALSSVWRVIDELVKLAATFIVWPEGEEVRRVFEGFAATSAFPKVIGAIDSTHINIRAPKIHPEAYINEKGHHSIILQAVCDHRWRFTHCYAGHVGSDHDQRVYRLSNVHRYMNDPEKFPDNCHVVGDAAYSLYQHLMTPYRDNGHLSGRQKNYNFRHASALVPIGRAFRLLKERFRSLRTELDIQRTDLIPKYIMACCVLHNICLLKNDEFPTNLDLESENTHYCENNYYPDISGHEKRDEICAELTMRNVN